MSWCFAIKNIHFLHEKMCLLNQNQSKSAGFLYIIIAFFGKTTVIILNLVHKGKVRVKILKLLGFPTGTNVIFYNHK